MQYFQVILKKPNHNVICLYKDDKTELSDIVERTFRLPSFCLPDELQSARLDHSVSISKDRYEELSQEIDAEAASL